MSVGTSRVTEKGQVTIPADMRKSLGLDTGTSVVFVELDDGVLLKSERKIRDALEPFDRRRRDLKLTREMLEKDVKEERKRRWSKNA
ncbi:MAG: AbrB/MazE/SpoVT family DNA-binding domain-containing protein [Euryarchaeota archaeon]|nr:AbrB/MazE/SpoVT family DNA-binding domain-containing protein [Euryarchaeota archaeon]